ncbi:2,5-dihydroxypyridine 5,6-dioxygenase [Klebsiella pneumoniae]|mgnify:FL=1|uniref:leucyl aminopeptidase n=1 Tax=Klebsiella pneumoniae complex TaxID=3390273 RepID=UPI0005221780|nr:leucyl aminopeptidase [Klebsiella pneumoniae]HDS4903798.1 2,5-dihydroxypyridine 5,6-dioxygenase [Klebsiella pneumoniae subsp. pneumoniae]HEO1536500.1 2,5-dihydroxypyridine 5,6-dioxygenase [Klebsiella aerogenes]MCW9184278.1 2,5-dihydroxypyridine 5,6-dioxygenase [Klebsiella pneumoniae]MDN4859875.1 2,5-dihydroxypyridine 5,6-dioxygenase [Klebsiella pneumoniae]CED73430.1 2,5-dihydroxypyridine 5,6-dioxygenase [Klebsiella pneumoniae]
MDQASFTEICLHQLKMSGVHEDEKLVVLTQGNERLEYADAFMAAGQRLGANMYHMRLPAPIPTGGWNVGVTGLAALPWAVEALKQCDMLIDCVFLLFSPEQFAIQAAGTRILTAVEPPELLARMLPNPELREKVEIAAGMLEKANVMRITSPYGTDVTYQLNSYPTVAEYGCTDTPGRWDHWPSGFVFTGGDDDGVNGQIVVAPGDILLPQNIYVREPITYTIEKGWITDIRGGLDAELVKSYMAAFDDPRGMGMSHVGWGMNPQASWHNMTPGAFPGGMGMEPRSYYGNVMFSTGPNNELGGPNDTACHLDIPMRGCSLFLDDEAIVIDGDIAVKEIQMQRY